MYLNEEQQRAITDLYQEMFYPLSAYAKSALNDRLFAEEAVQDTFRIACAKVDNLLSSSNPKGWLFNTLKFVIYNMLRSQTHLYSIVIASLDENERIAPTVIEELSVDVLYSDLARQEDFKLLKMIALDRCTILEASQELGISLEACKKRAQRAKTRLKKYFEKY